MASLAVFLTKSIHLNDFSTEKVLGQFCQVLAFGILSGERLEVTSPLFRLKMECFHELTSKR